MQIQISTDSNIKGNEQLTREVEAIVEDTLGRFSDQITRVEVHLTDESSDSKTRDNDIRCVMEARPAGLQPITVTQQGPTLDQVLRGCVKKLEKTLKRNFGRLDDHKGRTSYAGDQTI